MQGPAADETLLDPAARFRSFYWSSGIAIAWAIGFAVIDLAACFPGRVYAATAATTVSAHLFPEDARGPVDGRDSLDE